MKWRSRVKLKENRVPLSSTQTPSVPHIGSTKGPHLLSTQNPSVPPPQFHTKNSSVQGTSSVLHQKPLSSTPKPPQFHTKSPSVPHRLYKIFCQRGVLNWGVFDVELRMCRTEGFLVWDWEILGLKRSGPFVWNRCVELRGLCNWGGPKKYCQFWVHLHVSPVTFKFLWCNLAGPNL